MAKIVWNAPGERMFEAGVDRGVLYVDGFNGTPWNGLISVTESPTGGEVTPYYIDGIKYLNHSAAEEFEATIEAFTYPEHFDLCTGMIEVENGLYVTQQPRKSFGLSYRSKVGNDLEGIDHGYKIHLIYNATVVPSDVANATISEEMDPINFTWAIFTKPPLFTGYRPSAHFEIDSRVTSPATLESIEAILYGTETEAPALPSIFELLALFGKPQYEGLVYDAGLIFEIYKTTVDSGNIFEPQLVTADGGGP